MSKQNLDIPSYTITAAHTLPANNRTNEADKKTENIVRLGRSGKYTIEEIAKLTFSGTLRDDFFSPNDTPASKMAMQDTLRHTPIKDGAFKSYCVWVIGVLDEYEIEIDLS